MAGKHLISVVRHFHPAAGHILIASFDPKTKTISNLTSCPLFTRLAFLISNRRLALCETRHWQDKWAKRELYSRVAKRRTEVQYLASKSRLRSRLIGSRSKFPWVKTSSCRFSCAISFISSLNSSWSNPSFTFFHNFAVFLFRSSPNIAGRVRFLSGFSIQVGCNKLVSDFTRGRGEF